MTREEILAMEPGRELDALVAVEVMGWQKWTHTDIDDKEFVMIVPPKGDKRHNWAAIWDDYGCPQWLPDYSRKISAAWEVLREFGYYKIEVSGAMGPDCIEVFVGSEPKKYSKAEAIEAPEAICKAALLAVMEIEL